MQSESGSIAVNRPLDWLTWKPTRYYHPICWVKQMNGATKLHEFKGTKKLPSQLEIIKYLSGSDEKNLNKSLELHMEDIGQLVGKDLDYISIFDLVSGYDFTFMATEHPSMTSNKIANPRSNTELQRLLSAAQRREKPLQGNALALLNRTLVDSGTKYRILYTKRYSLSILKAFICGWHPDALDTFDNYFGASSRFLDSRGAMWTTTITILHWSIQDTGSLKSYSVRFHEGRTKGDFPPASIANLQLANGTVRQKNLITVKPIIRVIEERSTSLVMTGDSQGFFWLCSIWSSLTVENVVAQ